MTRLIDADALKESIDLQKNRRFTGCTIGDAMKTMIDEQPTIDAVPIIRCKDCKYAKPIDSEWLECQHDKRVMKENGFCSWSEPKEKE